MVYREVRISKECPECVALGLNKEEYALTLGPPQKRTEELTPILFTGVIDKAHEFLSSRGIRVSEIVLDRQGTHYFEMQDLEGNVIEITEEP